MIEPFAFELIDQLSDTFIASYFIKYPSIDDQNDLAARFFI